MFGDDNYCLTRGVNCSYANSNGSCSRVFSGCVRDETASFGAAPASHYCSYEKHDCEFADSFGNCTKSVCDNPHPAHMAAILNEMYKETKGWFDK